MVSTLRRAASQVKQQFFPRAEIAAWRHACRLAEHAPRHTQGEIVLDGYRIAYADLLTLCPQWHDIFVQASLRFEASAPAPRILDCGANIGLASLYYKRLFPAARISAFEADPTLAALCRRNLEANGAADVGVQAVAIWTDTGTVRFRQEGADSGAIDGTSAGVDGPAVDVPSVRLRDLLAHERADLLKLDIEGAEHIVLPDCADVLTRVDALLVDVHEFDPEHRGLPALLKLLTAAGFEYAIDNLNPLPWRGVAAGPFPHTASAWAMLVRAWRPRA
jgi:FkbM family methyltransferase